MTRDVADRKKHDKKKTVISVHAKESETNQSKRTTNEHRKIASGVWARERSGGIDFWEKEIRKRFGWTNGCMDIYRSFCFCVPEESSSFIRGSIHLLMPFIHPSDRRHFLKTNDPIPSIQPHPSIHPSIRQTAHPTNQHRARSPSRAHYSV
eukprot:jgi/Psemu1/31905/gm1.31905_g